MVLNNCFYCLSQRAALQTSHIMVPGYGLETHDVATTLKPGWSLALHFRMRKIFCIYIDVISTSTPKVIWKVATREWVTVVPCLWNALPREARHALTVSLFQCQANTLFCFSAHLDDTNYYVVELPFNNASIIL